MGNHLTVSHSIYRPYANILPHHLLLSRNQTAMEENVLGFYRYSYFGSHILQNVICLPEILEIHAQSLVSKECSSHFSHAVQPVVMLCSLNYSFRSVIGLMQMFYLKGPSTVHHDRLCNCVICVMNSFILTNHYNWVRCSTSALREYFANQY